MAAKKCEYCGELYDEKFEGTLENGCPACPACVEYDESKSIKSSEEQSENAKEDELLHLQN